MKISPARTAAFEILNKIETKRAFSSDLLAEYERDLSVKDRGLCHELTLGVLRRQIYLDGVIDHLSKVKKLDVAVRIAIRIGLYQILFLDKIPIHAAVNESVNLVQKAKKSSAKSFVNAILRRATLESISLVFADATDRLSVESSHPRWLIEKWVEEFGFDDAVKIANTNNTVPLTAFRSTRGDLPLLNLDLKTSQFVDGCFIVEWQNEQLRSLAASGDVYLQDEASQMVASSIGVSDGDRILDVCAAPGGKTTIIAKHASTRHVLIAAGDLRGRRIDLLKQNCEQQDVGFVNIVQYDAEKALPFPDEYFDLVLVDAPCSGTGTIRHNPEIRYFLLPDDFDALAVKQLKILKNASKLVKSGGTLVYSTCSLELEENESVCERFLGKSADFEKIRTGLHEKFETPDGFARTFPHRDAMDGFFVAGFRRVG